MGFDFKKVFFEKDGGLCRPEKIADTIILIKDTHQAVYLKLLMSEWLKENGVETSFLPEIRTVHDHARELSGTGPGKEIREEDFIILTERAGIEGLSDKFRKKTHKNYKKNLLRLINYRGLAKDGEISEQVSADLENNGLNSEVLDNIVKYINSFGFYFKYQIFENIKPGNESGRVFYFEFYPEELSYKEREFIKYYGINIVGYIREGKLSILPEAFAKGTKGIDTSALEFHVSVSAFDEAEKIKHLIMQKVVNGEFDISDITVVCSDHGIFDKLNNSLYISSIPACSSYMVKGKDISTDILRLISAGIENDTQAVMNFYNLYFAVEPVKFGDLSKIPVKELKAKINKGKSSDLILKPAERNDKELITEIDKYLAAVDEEDNTVSVDRALGKIYGIIRTLKEFSTDIELDVYAYEETVRKIFGDEVLLSELVRYLYTIASKSGTVRPNKDTGGVKLCLDNEPVPSGGCLILSGLSESAFLKTGNSVKILAKENYEKLYESVFGISPDHALSENLRIFASGGAEKAVLFVPAWGEETIPSVKIDKLLSAYDPLMTDIKVFGDKYGLESRPELKNAAFSLRSQDIISDPQFCKNIDTVDKAEVKQRTGFPIIYMGTKPLNELLSSASRIESFCSCPAKFVHEQNFKYDEIEEQFPFIKGNFYHDMTEKFLNFYKGKDLLNKYDHSLVSEIFINDKGTLTASRSNAFAQYMESFQTEQKYQKYEDGFRILRNIIERSDIIEIIDQYNAAQLENDPLSFHKNGKQKYGFLSFLAELLIHLGPTPASVTATFLTETKFCDLKISNDPEIEIGTGYIDLMYIGNDGRVNIVDIKSARKFDEFAQEIKEYKKVQLLLYKEAVLRQMQEKAGVNFDVDNSGRNPDCAILPEGYFDNTSGEVSAFYVSPNKPFIESCDDQKYDRFLDEFTSRYNDGVTVFPISNPGCEYCSISASCPENESSKFEDMDIGTSKPSETEFPGYNIVKEPQKEKPKHFILFEGQKNEAVASESDIIISAGAGAGKTEVLSSKFLHIMINESDTEIENIVCITFTNKAAGEMQKRIYSKLCDTIESAIFIAQDLGSDFGSYKLSKEQITKLKRIRDEFYDKNLISTFHSFCNSMISKYGYFSPLLSDTDLSPELSEDDMTKDEAVRYLKEIFSENFKNIFEDGMKDNEKEVFSKWLSMHHLIYSGDNEGGFIPDLLGIYSQMKTSGREIKSNQWLKPLEEYLEYIQLKLDRAYGSFKSHREELTALLEKAIASTDESKSEKLRYALGCVQNDSRYNFGNKIRGKGCEEIRAVTAQIKNSSGYKLIHEINYDLSLNKDEWMIKKAVLMIIAKLDEHLKDFKRKKGIIEQDDLHINFIKLLQDKKIKQELQDQFRHILIDEFQDTNWLQDRIVSELKTDSNILFIVGDRKQSIYRFRQCDVQIYEKYLDMFKSGRKVFNDNYRSVPKIVEFNNTVFGEYDDPDYKIIPQGELSEPKRKKGNNEIPVSFVNIFSPEELNDNTEITVSDKNKLIRMTEAAYLAEMLKKNCPDNKGIGTWAVLIRKYTHVGYLTEALRKFNIPYTLILKRDLFKLPEVIEFITVLKTGMGIIKEEEVSFIKNSSDIVSSLKAHDDPMAAIFCLYYNNDYRKHIASGGEAETKLSNLKILTEALADIINKAQGDRELFLSILDKQIKNNSAGVEVRRPDALTIITVHSAKGLEFDNLILANVDENDRSRSGQMNFLNKYENGVHELDFSISGYKSASGKDLGSFFINEYIKFENKQFDIAENANLLYVALTRAKNSLTVMILTKKEKSNSKTDGSLKWANFLQKFAQVQKDRKGFCFIRVPVGSVDFEPFTSKNTLQTETVEAFFEKGYDLPLSVKEQMTSATRIAHEKDDDTSGKSSSLSIDTGNFVHLFLSTNIRELFDPAFDIPAELEKFKTAHLTNSGVNMNTAARMLENVRDNSEFGRMVGGYSVLCEKNIVDTSENLQGYIDLTLIGEKEVIVLDYKTYLNKFPDDELIEKYEKQVEVYASALSKIYPDKKITKYLFFIGRNKAELREIY